MARSTDFAFANNVRAAIDLRTPRTSRLLLFSTLALFMTSIVWSAYATLDEVKRGNGRVIPTSQSQVIQSLEGGLVEAILVKEGATVTVGAPLIRVDSTNFASQLGEVSERRAAMLARVLRLEAESAGANRLDMPADLLDNYPGPAKAEQLLFAARLAKLTEELSVFEQQQEQKRRETEELKASLKRLTDSHTLTTREVQLTRNLYSQRIVPEMEMIRANQKLSEVAGQIEQIRQSIPKSEAAFKEMDARIATARATFRAQAGEDLAKSRGDLAVLEETIKSANDKVRRTELRSPVNGIINKVNVTTIGAVVQPGSVIMEIVPMDDTLLIEGRIRPQDIAFIRPDQDAVVKITAYDPYVYGSLKGRVERISADAIADEKLEKGETFYRVMVRTDRNHLGTPEKPLPIIPGMVATVEVLTGRKTVLDYVLKPARVLKDEALRER